LITDSVSLTHAAMGTLMAHRAYGVSAETCLADIQAAAFRLEAQFSRFNPQSDISRINQNAGREPVIISRTTFEGLSHALSFSKRHQAYLDITIGPLVDLWRKSRETGEPPEAAHLRQALSRVNAASLVLTPGQNTAWLPFPGQSIDLGGIGKGLAGDHFLELYQKHGIRSAYSNLGGHVVALGCRPDGSPWKIGVQHPRQPDCLIGLVSVEGKSVVTSGDYQRFFTGRRGEHFHHILDPGTGYPAQSGLASVTVVAESSTAADALSTILFVAGLQTGLDILNLHPGCEGIFVDQAIAVWITPGLKDTFIPADGVMWTIL